MGMTVVTMDGTGAIVREPDWASLLTHEAEITAAREYWRVVTTEMKDRQILAAVNGHSLRRLVCCYIAYDRLCREVAENGAVTRPRKGNARAIARISPQFAAMREAASDAADLEAELCLSPRRRAAATKAERKQRVAAPAERYLAKQGG